MGEARDEEVVGVGFFGFWITLCIATGFQSRRVRG